MKLLKASLLLAVFFVSVWSASPARAVATTEFTPKPDSPVMLTGYAVTGPRLAYAQLYNPEDTPIDLTGWKLEYSIEGQAAPVVVTELSGWLAPANYVVAGSQEAVPTADFSYQLTVPAEVAGNVISLRVTSPNFADISKSIEYDTKQKANTPYCPKSATTTSYWQRNMSESTGNYTSTFSCFAPDAAYQLYAGGLYAFPANTSLQVSEILPNPRECSPVSSDLSCREYVKLYNPSTSPVDLSQFRLRVGYQGQSATSSNTYHLAGVVAPGQYITISEDASGKPVSLTDSGSFVWLEDTYGLTKYAGTVQSYPDATSVTKEGAAWAYDERDGAWKWTAQPTPGRGASTFVTLAIKPKSSITTKQLQPCKAGQYRSKETNRCRSVANVATASMTPCKPGQTRSPETNRCRKNVTLASSLKPCAANQERSLETNRCRKKTGNIPEAAFGVQPVKQAGKEFAGWWAVGGVGVVAVGYGAWEWRHEVFGALRKIAMLAGGRK